MSNLSKGSLGSRTIREHPMKARTFTTAAATVAFGAGNHVCLSPSCGGPLWMELGSIGADMATANIVRGTGIDFPSEMRWELNDE